MDSTEYYNENAAEYFDRTVDLDMKVYLDRFLEFVPEGGSILDLGCGSGRDSAYFMSLGYDVTAMDGSEEMCSLAGVHIGKDVLHMTFDEMDFEDVFDGVWANASLLHVPRKEIADILHKVIRSLKKDGVLYLTLRYGEYEGEEEKRYFTYYRTRDLKELLAEFDALELLEMKKYDDCREEKELVWLHALVKKTQ